MSNHTTIELHGTAGVAVTTIQKIVSNITACIKENPRSVPSPDTTLISTVPTKLTTLDNSENGKHQSLFMVRICAPESSRSSITTFVELLKKALAENCKHFEVIFYH